MECSPLVESEKDCNYLHVKAVEEEQNLEPEVGELVDVDAHVQKKVYEFYFIKFRPSKHQNVISRIEKAEKLIEEMNQEADPMTRKWTKSTFELDRLNRELQQLCYRESIMGQYLARYAEKLNDQLDAQDKLNFTKNTSHRILHRLSSNNLATERQHLRQLKDSQERVAVDCSLSSVKEFSELIQNMSSELQSLSNNKTRDGKILGEIKKLEQEGNKSKKDHISLINKISEEVKKERLTVKNKIKRVKKEQEILEKEIDTETLMELMNKIYMLEMRKNQLNQEILLLKRILEKDDMISRYDRYVSVMNNARELARKKDIKALEELSLQEVGTLMSKRNESKAFRISYERNAG